MLAHGLRVRHAGGAAHRTGVALLAALAVGCGPTAEIASVTPSEVMNVSAWVTAKVTGADAAQVFATALGAPGVRTPLLPISDDGVTVALLGMRADTSYEVKVKAVRGSSEIWSEPMTFGTGSLPAGLPAFTADGPPEWLETKTLLGVVDPAAAAHAAVVVDGEGQVIWYHLTDHPVTDFQRQPDGTYTACELSPGDTHYDQFDREGRLLRTWAAPPPETAGTDWHDLRMLPGGLALFMGTETRVMDLSAMGGSPTANVVGNVVYRVQPDGEVLFRWSAFDHLAIDDIDPAVDVTGSTVDWTHADAIDVGDDGTYLLTFRNLSQLVKINAGNGAVVWRMGGKRSDFTLLDDPLGGFSFPHGARLAPGGDLVLFDNGNGRAVPQSRAVEYSLNEQRRVGFLAWSRQPATFSPDLGFAQRLPAGGTLVSYGTQGVVEELSPGMSGPIWTLRTGAPIYRALRVETLY